MLLGALLLFAPLYAGAAGVEDGATVLSGIVRDAHGVAQMGVLVQVFAPGLGAVGSAVTDEHGRYTISHLNAGQYRVLATAALFAPVNRSAVQLSSGAHAVMNLTMAALFDTASWLPAQRRRADEPVDDWTWTLRSSADRPILRFEDDRSSTSNPESPASRPLRGTLSIVGGTGQLGQGETQEAIVVQQPLTEGAKLTYRLASANTPDGAIDMSAAWDETQGLGEGLTTLVHLCSQPQLRAGTQQGGIETLSIGSAQRRALGHAAEMELGSDLQVVRAGSQTLVTQHPFFRLTAVPGRSWRVQYRLATSRAVQGSDQLQADRESVPEQPYQDQGLVAPDAGGQLQPELGRHQELSLAHDVASGKLELRVYRDNLETILLSGTGAAEPDTAVLTQRGTGNFALLAKGYTANGASVSYTLPLRGVWLTAEYAVGDALAPGALPASSVEEATRAVHAVSSQTALIALRGHVRHSGTQVRASYRWQPEGDISAVDPYNSMNSQAFLGFFVRQRMHLASWVPAGLEATINISNLLAQGYWPFLSEDGRTLYLAQTPRSVQGGLAFNF